MRLGPYYAYASTTVSATLALLAVLSLVAWNASALAAAMLSVAGVHWLSVGILVTADWHGTQRQLRAIQRIQSRGRGRAWRWFCRDSRKWWRVNGIGLTVCGAVLLGAASTIPFL